MSLRWTLRGAAVLRRLRRAGTVYPLSPLVGYEGIGVAIEVGPV